MLQVPRRNFAFFGLPSPGPFYHLKYDKAFSPVPDVDCVSIFIWELFPEWIFPLLTGFSIFCLANQKSPDFTRVFGGSNGNEGLGLLSIGFDWQYISGSEELPAA